MRKLLKTDYNIYYSSILYLQLWSYILYLSSFRFHLSTSKRRQPRPLFCSLALQLYALYSKTWFTLVRSPPRLLSAATPPQVGALGQPSSLHPCQAKPGSSFSFQLLFALKKVSRSNLVVCKNSIIAENFHKLKQSPYL